MTHFGQCRVLSEIGSGSLSTVYHAVQEPLGREVAVKVLKPSISSTSSFALHLEREARMLSELSHPNVSMLHEFVKTDSQLYLVLEYIPGPDLAVLLARRPRLPPETAAIIGAAIARGLEHAHDRGIVHRDVKPANVLISLRGEVKLIDFGIAHRTRRSAAGEAAEVESLAFGTPAYMSPEQVKGQGTVDHRADLWALGCMAYECLTGRPVWNTEQGVAMTFAAIAASALPVPSEFRHDLPPTFDLWFRRALERDPNRRFQTARELADALARAFGESALTSLRSGELDVAALLNQIGRPSLDLDDPLAPGASRPGTADSGRSLPQGADSARSQAQGPVSVDSARSIPQGLDSARILGASGAEMPGTATSAGSPHRRGGRGMAVRYAASVVGLIVTSSVAYLTWDRVLRPQVRTQLVHSTVPYLPEAPTSPSGGQGLPQDAPRWETTLGEGQQLFAIGDVAAAQEKFKHAQELGAPPAASRAFADETKAGLAGGGDCKMSAFSRPRMALAGNALRPSVASSTKRTLVSWSDDHEQPGHQHVYAVLLDPVGRPLSRPRDLTPEAIDAGRASLVTVGDRMALVYSDKSGPEVGVRVRWIDEDGRIAGASMQVGGVRPGAYSPALQRAPDGLFAAWDDERKRDGADLFLRHLGQELSPIGPEIRATDYSGRPGHRPAIRAPNVALANGALYLVYKVEREGKPDSIERMRIPLDAPSLATGLDFSAGAAIRTDRALGDVQVVSEDRSPSDSPGIGCGTEGCFVVWHGEKGGAFAALIDPIQGRVVWRKRFAEKGSAPALGVSESGAVAVAYYEAGAVRLALMAREGVSAPSTFAKVSGEAPQPSVAPGRAKGEWLVAWQDNEGAHTEAYVARVVCHSP